MGGGTAENPYTREDVLRMIEGNGGTAEGLDLSDKVFIDDIDLSGFDLKGVILNKSIFRSRHEGAILSGAHLEGAYLISAHLVGANFIVTHLEGAYLQGANLERANLWNAHLEEAHLQGANLDRADFKNAHLEGANLFNAEFSYHTNLDSVYWGNIIPYDEEEKKGLASVVAHTYRRLKMWHTEHGMYDVAGEFYYREREARRKALKWISGNWHHRLAIQISYLVFGHGERWRRIPLWMLFPLIIFAMAYYFCGNLEPLDSLYFSAVSFTALGYGNWVVEPTGWVKLLGAVEAFIGILMMALLLVTIVRRWAR